MYDLIGDFTRSRARPGSRSRPGAQRRALALLALVTVGGGCGGDGGTGPDDIPQCMRSVESVSVSSGTTPTFSWQPRCRMAALIVHRADETETTWFISSGWAIAPGIRYGSPPAGAEVLVAAKPLVPGVEYVVAIMPPAGGSGLIPVLGQQQFTP